MAITVKKATIWRRELENHPGTLAEALKPFADHDINLKVVMGYGFPNSNSEAAVEIYPITDAKAEKAAEEAGFKPSKEVHALVIEGDDRPGLAYEIAAEIGHAKVNISFSIFQVIDKKFSGVFGFPSEDEAIKAEELIKQVAELVKK
jgi:hypothetical protein